MHRLIVACILALLGACGGGDPDDATQLPPPPDTVPAPHDPCGPNREYCI